VLAPLLREFMMQYPDIRIDLILSNYYLDLIGGGLDVAIRAGDFADSALIAKPLGKLQLCLVATPAYLQRHSQPNHPTELEHHECLLYSPSSNPRSWLFNDAGKTLKVIVGGKFQCDDGDVILDMALANEGITQLPYWMVYRELERGDLIRLLAPYAMPATNMKMLYPERKHLALKTRCFLDFMADYSQTHPAFDC